VLSFLSAACFDGDVSPSLDFAGKQRLSALSSLDAARKSTRLTSLKPANHGRFSSFETETSYS